MLNWSSRLYIGDAAKKNVNMVRRRLDHGKPVPRRYLITLAVNEADQLDIISTSYLIQKALVRRLPMVIGIAATKEEAFGIVTRITEDCYRARGDADLRAYLADRG